MQLIAPLLAGFANAPLGHAEIYVRGTATRATWYASLEGDSPNSTGANITLSAQGAALVYVNQLVDVVVKDVDGVQLWNFGDGVAAPNVEVRSLAFTGIDYDTAASAPGNPTNLKAMADLWLAKNGAIDWQVLFNGAATTIQSALGPLVGLVYNVMSPAYGGVGDGVASDQSAVAAALAAAVAAGGGIVFFPEGTYRLTSAIAWDNSVMILGVGMNKSVITMDAAGTKTLRFTAANTTAQPTLIMGVTFQSSQSNTGTIVDLEAVSNVRFVECSFGGNTNSLGTQIDVNASSTLACERCVFNIRSATLSGITTDSATSSTVKVHQCTFIGPASFTGAWCDLQYTFLAYVTDSFFDGNTNTTGGTHYGLQVGDNYATIVGNRFSGGAFTACIRIVGASDAVAIVGNVMNAYAACIAATAAAKVFAYGNASASTFSLSLGATLANGSYIQLNGRTRDTSNSTTPTIGDGVDVLEFVSTGANPTFTMPTILHPAQRMSLTVLNSSGAGWAGPVFTGAVVVTGVAIPAVGNTASAHFEFIVEDLAASGTYVWRLVYAVG